MNKQIGFRKWSVVATSALFFSPMISAAVTDNGTLTLDLRNWGAQLIGFSDGNLLGRARWLGAVHAPSRSASGDAV